MTGKVLSFRAVLFAAALAPFGARTALVAGSSGEGAVRERAPRFAQVAAVPQPPSDGADKPVLTDRLALIGTDPGNQIRPPGQAWGANRGPSAGERGAAASAVAIQNGGFETGDFTGWQVEEADASVVSKEPPPPCFQPEMPSEGSYMACLSTDAFFGGSANGGVASGITSNPIVFTKEPGKIIVTFTVDFQTAEPFRSIAHNDDFQARLITPAGTFVMLQIDTFGLTPPGKGLSVEGFTGFVETAASCPLSGFRTKRVSVTWKRSLDSGLRSAIGAGPVFIEFSLSNEGDAARTSIACIDDVQMKVSKP